MGEQTETNNPEEEKSVHPEAEIMWGKTNSRRQEHRIEDQRAMEFLPADGSTQPSGFLSLEHTMAVQFPAELILRVRREESGGKMEKMKELASSSLCLTISSLLLGLDLAGPPHTHMWRSLPYIKLFL